MRIGYIALWSPQNVKNWSGTPYYSYHSLKAIYPNLVLIDTLLIDKVMLYANKILRRLFNFDPLREPISCFIYKIAVDRAIRAADLDVIVSVGASHKLCDTDTDVKIVHVSDALFLSIVESYARLSQFSGRSKRLGHALQERFLEKVDVLCLSSDWAVNSGRDYYDLSSCDVRMLPLGANLDRDPGFDIEKRLESPELSLLFVGGEWERKGGPFAIEAFRNIRARYPKAELNIVGCTPDIEGDTGGIVVHGFLNKSDQDELRRFDTLYRNASFLFVPSRQEANAVVFAEACAYGLPIVSTNTGGIGTSVVQGVNGLLLPLEESPDFYADKIVELWENRHNYARMAQGARDRYENTLSWQVWARRVSDAVEEINATDSAHA